MDVKHIHNRCIFSWCRFFTFHGHGSQSHRCIVYGSAIFIKMTNNVTFAKNKIKFYHIVCDHTIKTLAFLELKHEVLDENGVMALTWQWIEGEDASSTTNFYSYFYCLKNICREVNQVQSWHESAIILCYNHQLCVYYVPLSQPQTFLKRLTKAPLLKARLQM